MKLNKLVEFYRANGFVVVSAGNGCTDPQWVDYAEAMAIDTGLGDVEMRAASMAEADEYEQDYRRALDDVDGLCKVAYASEWLTPDNRLWDGVDLGAYRWRIFF